MVAIRSHEADRFLASDAAGFLAYLVHGADVGLVSERVRLLLKLLVDDPADPFQVVRLRGDDVAGDPGRLADEANTVPMFGGRRAVVVDATARNLLPAIEHHLASPSPAPLILEAGALKKDAPLRKLIERARTAVALECYPDSAADVVRLIEADVAEAGLRIEPDAKAMLAALLGADRLASRGEIAKLILYAHGRPAITAEDVEAVVADATAQASDALIDAAFAGDMAGLDLAGRRVLLGSSEAGVLLGAALRHAVWLHRAKLDIDGGARPEQVMASAARVGLGAKLRREKAERALAIAPADALGQAVERLGEAIGRARREPLLGPSIALRTLWTVARAMQRRGRQG